MNLYNIIWIIIAAISAAAPVSFIKKYIENKNYLWIILSIISYIILILSYSIILIESNMIVVYSIVKILSLLIVGLLGIIFFNEKLNFKEGMGILLGIVSIYLLSSN